jgi:hypothetical protein
MGASARAWVPYDKGTGHPVERYSFSVGRGRRRCDGEWREHESEGYGGGGSRRGGVQEETKGDPALLSYTAEHGARVRRRRRYAGVEGRAEGMGGARERACTRAGRVGVHR